MVTTKKVRKSNIKGNTQLHDHDSDDDFMTPPLKEFRSHKRKRGDNRKAVYDKPKGKVKKTKPQSINNRNPPRILVDLLPKFTDEQKDVVRRIGFEHVLGLSVGKLLLKLGFWLLENYNSDDNTFTVCGQKLLVSKEAVYEVYGFPIGEVEIKVQKKVSTEDPIVIEINGQFSNDLKRLWISNIIPKMLEDEAGGRMFLQNFLVLIVTILIGAPGVGTVNRKFLPSIVDENTVRGLDWCSYTIICLKESKEAWKASDPTCNFTGPLTFLVRDRFYDYLETMRHPMVRTLRHVVPCRLSLSWQTSFNGIDCGVFLMRHMEMIKGASNFDAGLRAENNMQQVQLDDLRRKYASKILLSGLNTRAFEVDFEAKDQDKLPMEWKIMVEERANKIREERLAVFGK